MRDEGGRMKDERPKWRLSFILPPSSFILYFVAIGGAQREQRTDRENPGGEQRVATLHAFPQQDTGGSSWINFAGKRNVARDVFIDSEQRAEQNQAHARAQQTDGHRVLP